jgi:hypothetical protein
MNACEKCPIFQKYGDTIGSCWVCPTLDTTHDLKECDHKDAYYDKGIATCNVCGTSWYYKPNNEG